MRRSNGPWYRAAKNSWFVWLDGKAKNLFVKGEENEKQAVKAWHRLMGGEAVQGDHSTPTQPTQPKNPTRPQPDEPKPSPVDSIPSLVKAFLSDAKQRVKVESYRGYAKYLDPFALAFSTADARNITSRQVEAYSKGREWSQSYRSGFIGTVAMLFKWAVSTGRMDRSPVAGMKKPAKTSRGRKAVISRESHERLLKHAQGDWKPFLSLLWLTGCRPGEIASLTAQDVDIANRCIVLSQHKTAEQTGKDRLIVLQGEAVDILSRLVSARPTGLLFPDHKGGRLTSQAIGRRMARLCAKAGVKAIAYGYRHTFATDALSQGVPDATVAALLGHQGTGMLHKHYSHLTSQANVLRDAASKIR